MSMRAQPPRSVDDYFAAFRRHLGLYPPVSDPSLQTELAPFAGPKGNLQFPLAQPIPLALIRRVVQARAAENLRKQRARIDERQSPVNRRAQSGTPTT